MISARRSPSCPPASSRLRNRGSTYISSPPCKGFEQFVGQCPWYSYDPKGAKVEILTFSAADRTGDIRSIGLRTKAVFHLKGLYGFSANGRIFLPPGTPITGPFARAGYATIAG